MAQPCRGKNTSEATKEVTHAGKSSRCYLLKTEPVKKLVSQYKFDAIIIAIRRDGHGLRARERRLGRTFASGLIVLCEPG